MTYQVLIVIGFLFCGGLAIAGEPIVVDSFDAPMVNAGRFASGPRAVELGYGVFYEGAQAKLNLTVGSDGAKRIRLAYRVPELHRWGNWLSICREFQKPIDLSGFDGLALRLRIETPSAARLRVTICDLTGAGTDDEMWWFDSNPGLLGDATGWQWVRIPFSALKLSEGAGVRHNDGRFDPTKIVAYEINFLSPKGRSVEGAIVLDELIASPVDEARPRGSR